MKISKTSYSKRIVNNQKLQKFVPVLEENFSEKCSKTFCQIFERQKMQNQTNVKHSINSENIFKSTKNVFEKCSAKEDPSNTATSKVFSKVCNRKNIHSNNITFPWLKVF